MFWALIIIIFISGLISFIFGINSIPLASGITTSKIIKSPTPLETHSHSWDALSVNFRLNFCSKSDDKTVLIDISSSAININFLFF